MAALQCAGDIEGSMKRLADRVEATSKPEPKPHEVKRLLRLFHRDLDGMLKRTED